MSNTPYIRAKMAQTALELAHPLIRGTLLDDAMFREAYGFTVNAALSFGDSGVSMPRDEVFDAIRAVLTDASELEIKDTEGHPWKLVNEAKDDSLPSLTISTEDRRLVLPDFSVLSPDSAIRLRSLEEAASDTNLPAGAREAWRKVLTERALQDDEVDNYHSDFRDTPAQLEQSIRSQIRIGQSSVTSLVPTSRRYFDRLVGGYDGSKTIKDYAAGGGRNFLEKLSEWRPYEGFLYGLFLSSHSALTAELNVERLESKDLVRAYDSMEKHGDITSQLGAIEVGLRILPERPEIESYIIGLIRQTRDDDIESSRSGLKLFSALFVLVDGELSRTQLMSEYPPFYRRLASLSQAALILRQLLNSGVSCEPFCEWAFNNRGEQYYMQSLGDMRLEPRWNPDFALAAQMKADFFGRIMIAGKNFENGIEKGELYDLVLGAEPGSLHSLSEFPRPYFPGPLEGAENSPIVLPADLSAAIKAQLNKDEVGPSSFIALVNSAMVFRVDSEQADLAAKALKLGNYRLANVENKSQLLAVLNGLATVAAAGRNLGLADELRTLVRRYRRNAQFRLSIEEAMRICLVASASRENLNDWREFAGDWLAELAFGELEGDEGKVLLSHLQCLCHAVPELWVSCGRADAALRAFNGR